jgi:hypothetical protein
MRGVPTPARTRIGEDAPLFAGPIIAREILTTPRPIRFYAARAVYTGLLFVLMWTAWQSLIGWQAVHIRTNKSPV